ncbi:MAG: NlpC/P60 family protein [Candidatus Magasanikbacteria bacterium]
MKLNQHITKRIKGYLNLNICDFSVRAPYHINFVENQTKELIANLGISDKKIKEFHREFKNQAIEYGWGLGKSTPEELEEYGEKLVDLYDLDQSNLTKRGLRKLMGLHGIGVDCSGFVYQVLDYAFSQVGKENKFIQSLKWESDKIGVTRADVDLFNQSSREIDLSQIQPGDLVIINKEEDKHCGVVFQKEEQTYIAHSSLFVEPSGVSYFKLNIKNSHPSFDIKIDLDKEWSELYRQGALKFKRLDI